MKIKLVIWDLDNTLWRGTLAEGDKLIPIIGRTELIKNLTSMGIVNSICSKNDFGKAKSVLVKMGLWEYFVFPKISFEPKGQTVQAILDEMHLRAENTVFIDDEATNLQEVLYYNPEITILHESDCEKFFSSIKDNINADSQHSRLEQYRQLEKKTVAKTSYSSNEDFLRNSNIQIEFVDVTNQALFDRLCELTERTNQLNFTKNRMTPIELLNLLKSPNVKTQLIHATDNFGDYGLIGFYSLYQRNLIHFVFSCRIMNMGIEHFVYQYLDYPKIKVEGNTASQLSRERQIDYISILNEKAHEYAEESIEKILTEESQVNIFALGACDLYHPIAYFSLPNIYFLYECNVFIGNERGVNVGTEYIRSQYDMTEDEKNFCRHHFHNYTRYNVFKSKIFDEIWDYVIISFLDDMIYKIYENKNNPNIRVVLSSNKKYVINTSIINVTENKPATEEEKCTWLEENFNEGYYITPERFEENLLWIASRLPEKTKIILINGPELDFFNNSKAHEQILTLNKVIARVCETYSEKFVLADINKVIRSRDDVTNTMFHLKAQTAFNLFVQIANATKKYAPPTKTCMLHKVLNGRKVCVLGTNSSEVSIAYYDLFLGNVEIVDCNLKDLTSSKYYFLIADNKNYAEIRKFLVERGCKPIKDFVQFKSLPYVKVWKD